MRDGWREISLEDLETSAVIKLGRGDVISKKDMEADPGPNPVYSSAENKNGMIGKYAKFMFDEELITWSVDGGGHIFYRPKHKFSVTNIGGWLRILDDKVFSYQFLTYALQRLHKQHSFDWQHKAHPSVIRKLYTRIPLPPLPEQKRIVDLISSVDSYIAALKKQLESTKKSRKVVLRELLTTGGVGWEESTLGDLISHSIGGIWGEEQGGAEVDVPVYRQTEFSDSGILTTPAEAIRSVSKSQLKNRTLQKDDILIQKSAGTPNLPGRVVSVSNLNGEVATFSNFLNLLRPNTVKCIPRLAFLIFWDKHQDGRAFQYQRGTNIKNLDLPSYLLETILIPSAPDQKRIVELISTFDDFLAQTNHSISLFENLRSGLLSDLLSGNHEIPSTYEKVMGVM